MKGKNMQRPYNHYFYLLTTQRVFWNNLVSKYLRVQHLLKTKEEKHAFLNGILPDNLKRSGSLDYYDMAIRFYLSKRETYKFKSPIFTVLNKKFKNEYSLLKLFEGLNHFDFNHSFQRWILSYRENPITGELEDTKIFNGFCELLPCDYSNTGYMLKLCAPLYKEAVIIEPCVIYYPLDDEYKVHHTYLPWVQILFNILKMNKIKSKPLDYYEPNDERPLSFYRDAPFSKAVPSPSRLVF